MGSILYPALPPAQRTLGTQRLLGSAPRREAIGYSGWSAAVDARITLQKGLILDGSYRIERVIGSGGFGITYEVEDVNLGNNFALKEYYPFDFGDRDGSMSVRPKSERHQKTFEWGRASFLQEARMLARFRHPSIVRVTRVFEAYSTAYMVMEFEHGASFEQWLSGLGRLPTQQEIDRICVPLLDALELMHRENFLHRDIAPDNIVIRPDGTPVLLDFGAARRAVGEMSRALTGIVKAGYSPQEQYATDGRLQGPWSDLYAFGATLYRAIVGHPPEEATLRLADDRTRPAREAARGSYRREFLEAVDACLRPKHSARPQTVAQLRPMLLERAGPAPSPQATALGAVRATRPAGALSFTTQRWLLAAALLAIIGGSFGGFEYTRWSNEQGRVAAEDARRRADTQAAAAKKAEDEGRERAQLEAKKQQEEQDAAKKRSEEEARLKAQERELGFIAEARRNAEEQAKKAEESRVALEKRAVEERAQRTAQAERESQEGDRYFYGRGVTKDYDKAHGYYEKAASLGDGHAMDSLGRVYENGFGAPKDHAKARQWYEKGAAAGNAAAMNNFGRTYREGIGVPRDFVKAREWHEKAIAAGDIGAMVSLGWLYHNGWGVPRDFVKARELYEKAAAKGQAFGMNNLGLLYRDGLGVPKDYGKAREWFEKAAAAGNEPAMGSLGWLYENGLSVAKDFVKAREWYERGAAAGNVFSMTQLGWFYRQGLGGPQDYGKAREWSEKAASRGNGGAMNTLGLLFEHGNGVAQDQLKARDWYEKAAGAGNGFGMIHLAQMLDQGRGGPPDFVRAAKLLLGAAKVGHSDATAILRGTMATWKPQTRVEIKTELARLGHHKGATNDVWDLDTRAAIEKYVTSN